MIATRQQTVGAMLLAVVLGFVGAAILGPGGGVVSGVLVLIALIVAKNL